MSPRKPRFMVVKMTKNIDENRWIMPIAAPIITQIQISFFLSWVDSPKNCDENVSDNNSCSFKKIF